MYRYKFTDRDLKNCAKYLKTKKGKLQQKPWVTKFESDLTTKLGKVFYKEKEIIPKERLDAFLRKRIFSKDAE